MKKIIISCLFYLALNTVVYGGQTSKIELADGSVINGEIVALADGVYTIKNPATFGEIKVGAEKISRIESVNATVNNLIGQPNNPAPSQVAAYGQTLMQNPENAAVVADLTKNPELRKMAEDPELQAAAKKGDVQALLNNPKFMNIVNSPEVKEAVKELKK